MRFACDTGGTFTDLIVEDDDGTLTMYKASTTPSDPTQGVLDALAMAAAGRGESLQDFLRRGSTFIHGTTHAINAILTGKTARTAMLVTRGHREILTLREGGRASPFDFTVPFPKPYVPRRLTFEVDERVDGAGRILTPLDESAFVATLETLREQEVEAVAVCLLWSIINPLHEERVGALIASALPGIPFSLSHRLNPVLREYRRASATAIDASLKPLMQKYLGTFTERLTTAGFAGRTMILTSQGGMIDGATLAEAPIHSINSGPSMAPVAGRHFLSAETTGDTAIVADTGGTTYDVSLVRGGHIPLSRETWIGPSYSGHMTGFPSVDVKSVGAGGGSIAHVDGGGLLHVGPRSAGSTPGPACYGRGGTEPTVTDACIVLGYVDPGYFLGGMMALDSAAAFRAVDLHVARPMGVSVDVAAAAIVELATENMVQAIEQITVNQGIDPAKAVLIGGGGAAGLNSMFIARRLGCRELVIPEVGAALSAFGALISDITMDFRATFFTTSTRFDFARANSILDSLSARAMTFFKEAGDVVEPHIELSVDARYESQVWEIQVPLPVTRFATAADVAALVASFHDAHEALFTVRDEASAVEIIGWTAIARCRFSGNAVGQLRSSRLPAGSHGERRVFFGATGWTQASLWRFDAIPPAVRQPGPAIVESPFTTMVVDPGATFERTAGGSLIIRH